MGRKGEVTMARHIFPELVDGRKPGGKPWKVVQNSNSCRTNHKDRTIFLPSTPPWLIEQSRTHELLHVWATPSGSKTVYKGVDTDILQCVEDMRITYLGERKGVVNPLPPELFQALEGVPIQNNLKRVVEILMPLIPSHEWNKGVALMDHWRLRGEIEQRVNEAAVTIALEAYNMLVKKKPTFRHGVKVARWVTQMCNSLQPPAGRPTWEEPHYPSVGNDDWGTMEVHDMAKTGRQLRGTLQPKARDYGTAPVYPWRQMIDGRPFRHIVRRQRGVAGSVLLDASGSMGVNAHPDMVRAALHYAPCSSIAAYAGQPSGEGGGLYIMAKKGRRCHDHEIRPGNERRGGLWGGENVVDYPALNWLATQPAPRFWVSDGQVTGKNCKTNDQLRNQCKMYCDFHGIRRVRSPEEALLAMGAGAHAVRRLKAVRNAIK